MANANTPFGLSPHREPGPGQTHVYVILAADTNAYAIGDPVMLAGTGNAAGTAANVVLATAGSTNLVLGAIVGVGGPTFGAAVGAASPSFETTIIPATKTRDYFVLVADDPNLVFEIQEDGVGGQLAVTNIGQNCSLVSGANNGFVSGWMLDSSTAATTTALQCKIIGLAPRANNALGAYSKWLVRINNHAFSAATAGV